MSDHKIDLDPVAAHISRTSSFFQGEARKMAAEGGNEVGHLGRAVSFYQNEAMVLASQVRDLLAALKEAARMPQPAGDLVTEDGPVLDDDPN